MKEIITVSYKHVEDDEHLWAEIRFQFRHGSGTSFIMHHVHHAAGPQQADPSKLLEGGRADIVGYYKQDWTLAEFRKYERKMREALRSKESLLAYVREAQVEGTPAGVLRRLEEADLAFQPSAIAARPPERGKPEPLCLTCMILPQLRPCKTLTGPTMQYSGRCDHRPPNPKGDNRHESHTPLWVDFERKEAWEDGDKSITSCAAYRKTPTVTD